MSTTNGYYASPIKTRLSDNEPIPKGWSWVDLQEVARLESGHTPSRKIPEYWTGGDVPWLSLKDIRGMKSRYVEDTIDKPTMLGIDNSSARMLPKGTVAFCRTASVGNVAILGRDMATSQDFVDWVCGPNLLPEYLYEAFKASGPTFASEMQGSTHQTIYMPTVKRFKVLLPPLSEQKRIADILDKANAIRRKRQEGVFNFDLLSDSLFNQLSHDCHIQPQSVEALIESQILMVHKDGNFGGSYPRKHEFGLDGIPFLSAKHVAPDGTLSNEDVPRLNEEKARTLPFGWIERGDVLLAHNATVGPVALYGGDYKEALIGTSLTCYRPNPSLLKSEFLFAALRGSHFQRQLAKAMSQTTRNQVPITAQRKLTLHIPPLDQQQFFSEQLSAIRTLRIKHVKAASEADTLFSSLVQRAFKGKL